nr:immunoglobulin alpha Fc receptor isoform X1 [Castor canadensis]
MDPKDITIILCLVLCLGQRIQAQEGDFPIPTMCVFPGFVIPWNGSVKILCRGTSESFLYQLFILENSTHKVVEEKIGFQKEAAFVISPMNESTAGRYGCRYRKGYRWSEQSKTLQLKVSGLYEKPLLTTHQSLVMMGRENLSLRCSSAHGSFDRFSLVKEGNASLTQHQHGEHWVVFKLGPVDLSFARNYRCYVWHSSNPYVWSAPSDTLELIMADAKTQDYTVGNAIRMGMAGMLLVSLLGILIENWHSHRAPPKEGDGQDLAVPSWSKQKCPT